MPWVCRVRWVAKPCALCDISAVATSDAQAALDRAYKEHAARILAVLTRIFGVHNLQLAEDVLQEAFRKAVVTWQESGVPDQPAAWIMQTAKNQAIDAVRANKTRTRFASDLTQHLESEWSLGG